MTPMPNVMLQASARNVQDSLYAFLFFFFLFLDCQETPYNLWLLISALHQIIFNNFDFLTLIGVAMIGGSANYCHSVVVCYDKDINWVAKLLLQCNDVDKFVLGVVVPLQSDKNCTVIVMILDCPKMQEKIID